MTLKNVQLWHSRAVPQPDAKDFRVQLGCHVEEFIEMLDTLEFKHRNWERVTELLGILSHHLKTGLEDVTVRDRKEFLDSLADQVVTAIGAGYRAGVNVAEGVARVDTSNWSKFVDGEPQFDANGKIAKGPHYVRPDLSGLY